jgi:antitoxin VapB
MSTRIGKSLMIDGQTLVHQAAWNEELEGKQLRVAEWLNAHHLHGVLLKRNENIAWLTGGAVEVRVLTPNETGVAALLVMRDGRRYYFTTANEAPRLQDEEFGALDFEPVIFPWYANATDDKALELAGVHLGSDTHIPGFQPVNLSSLRASLQATEIARYRWLGTQTGAAVSEVLKGLEPGLTEYDVEARVAAALLSRGILPSVYLMAADERILKYKHAVARGKRIEKYAMINLCARKWGLTVSITRFAHFEAVSEELQAKFAAASHVNAALLDATRVGATSAELFKVAADAYAAAGFAGEEQLHHQGGATGYWEREWVATPEGSERVVNNQAFAWNPSVRGGKVEDTVLLRDGQIELLTPTPDLPALASSANGKSYPATGITVL